MFVEIKNKGIQSFETLDVIEFTSTRKRMSIVVKMPNGKYIIFF